MTKFFDVENAESSRFHVVVIFYALVLTKVATLRSAIMLDNIKAHLASNEELTEDFLTYKLTMFFALVSASRAVQIQHLDITHMGRLPGQFSFSYAKLHKGWRRGKSPPAVEFKAYLADPELCVVNCLNEYLLRSEPWRDGANTQLLLSFKKPYVQFNNF